MMMTGHGASSSLLLGVVIVFFDVECSGASVIKVSSELDGSVAFDNEELELLVESVTLGATLGFTQVGDFFTKFFTLVNSRSLYGKNINLDTNNGLERNGFERNCVEINH